MTTSATGKFMGGRIRAMRVTGPRMDGLVQPCRSFEPVGNVPR